MKVYVIERNGDGTVIAHVDDQGRAYRLPHLVKHSPTGFEYGYAGSGPADLARSIVGDFLNTDDPDPRLYQHVKFKFLAPIDRHSRQVVIRGDDLQGCLDEVS